MSPSANNAIRRAVDRLKPYKPERVILFGSYAWGKPKAWSDLDLFIVKNSRKPKIERVREVSELLDPFPLAVDALVYTPAEIKKRLYMGDMFVERIIKEGKIIYERKNASRSR